MVCCSLRSQRSAQSLSARLFCIKSLIRVSYLNTCQMHQEQNNQTQILAWREFVSSLQPQGTGDRKFLLLLIFGIEEKLCPQCFKLSNYSVSPCHENTPKLYNNWWSRQHAHFLESRDYKYAVLMISTKVFSYRQLTVRLSDVTDSYLLCRLIFFVLSESEQLMSDWVLSENAEISSLCTGSQMNYRLFKPLTLYSSGEGCLSIDFWTF